MTDHSPLISRLADEMILRWKRGVPVLAEELLNLHPELWRQPELAVELIYEEICLRKEHGNNDCGASVLKRFPQWRNRLEVMLECHRLLEVGEPDFPALGETLAGYRLLEPLGHGASGKVFLAQQSDLADRPVVIKLTSLQGQEHLNLARLQHTHIVPLYAIHDDPARKLRILCMPYLGGVTLDRLLTILADCPLEQRSGQSLLRILKATGVEPCGPAESVLGRLSFVQALCWIAACLADALHYAQESGLVHLDVKPANILIAADGQPMLLDFHLACKPLSRGDTPIGIGGTLSYMAPEQRAALAAISQGKPLPHSIDRRADVFGLGAVLYEALGGKLPEPPDRAQPLCDVNLAVSQGLSDIVAKCLKSQPEDRYADAAALALDLRCHLANMPLQGIANRSWPERYRKWRRRRPAALQSLALLTVVAALLTTLACGAWSYVVHITRQVEFALAEGRRNWHDRSRFAEAIAQMKQALELARSVPFQDRQITSLVHEIRLAEQAHANELRRQSLRDLHALAEQVRGLLDFEHLPPARLTALNQSCRAFWDRRWQLQSWLEKSPSREAKEDLLDVILLAAELQVRQAERELTDVARHQALKDLAEAERLFGPSSVLDQESDRHRRALKLPPQGRSYPQPPRTVWENLALGRTLLLADDVEAASTYLHRAVELQPHGFWPNFYHGQCAYRRSEYADAATAFSVCIGIAPDVACPYFNRALAFTGLGKADLAVRDFSHVLRLEPHMASALRNRGLLHLQARRFADAEADLQQAALGK